MLLCDYELSRLHSDFNTLRPRQNGRHFADDIFNCISLNENVWIMIKNSLKFVPKGLINNIPALVQIMAWHRPGDKPLSEPMLVSLPTHICVTRPQWVNVSVTYAISITGNPCSSIQFKYATSVYSLWLSAWLQNWPPNLSVIPEPRVC